jgi:thiol-disulfide isomerase/thioredoxin
MNPAEERRSMPFASLNSLCPLVFTVAVMFLINPAVQSSGQSGGGPNSQAAQTRAAYTLVPAQARQHAQDLNITDIAGNKLTLSQYRGKVVLLDFWAVDCGGCVIEIPWYVQFDSKYHDKGLQLIGLDMYGEAPAYIKSFMLKSQMKYPVAVGNDDIQARFQADSLPKTMLIDRQGRIAVSHVGIVDRDAFERDIEELLKEQ